MFSQTRTRDRAIMAWRQEAKRAKAAIEGNAKSSTYSSHYLPKNPKPQMLNRRQRFMVRTQSELARQLCSGKVVGKRFDAKDGVIIG